MASDSLIHLVHKGTLLSPQQFSWRITCVGPATASQSDLNTWLASVVTPCNTYLGATFGPKVLMASSDAFTALVAYFLPAGTATAALTASQSITGGGTNSRSLPYQCASVVSLRTVLPGRKGRGRFYLPTQVTPNTANGQLTSAMCSGLATATATYLTALAGLACNGTNTIPVVASPLGSAQPATITGVVVDSIIDTQRRRRDKVGAVAIGTHTVP